MPAAEDERSGLAMACFATLLTMGVEVGISPSGRLAINCSESQWPAVKHVLDHAPATFADLIQEHCCEPYTVIDAPFVPDAVRFNHRKNPNLLSWRTERGRVKQMTHRKRKGRWEWTRVR
jgi:hypothetical protein